MLSQQSVVTCLRVLLASLAFAALTGCSTEPKSPVARQDLLKDSQTMVAQLKSDDPSLSEFLGNAYAYVIFPDVGKGGFIVGAAYGHGNAFQGGNMVGYAEITQGSVGLQVGGQEFAELIVFKDKGAFDNFTDNHLTFEAAASAVILRSGAAAAAKYDHGIAIFTKPKAGAMVEAQVGGQRFTYKPVEAPPATLPVAEPAAPLPPPQPTPPDSAAPMPTPPQPTPAAPTNPTTNPLG